MSMGLERLVQVRSQLTEEVLAYLTTLLSQVDKLPRYYPAHLQAARDGFSPFDTIRQQVQVATDRSAFEQWRATEMERLRAAGFDPERLAYAPTRAWLEDEGGPRVPKPPLPSPPVPWDEQAAERFRRAVILADPGFGKTYLLRYEAHRLARQGTRQLLAQAITVEDLTLPIFLRLSDVARWLRDHSQQDEEDEVAQALVMLAGAGRTAAFRDFMRRRLHTDRGVILLDAWDEVPLEVPAEGHPIEYKRGYRQHLGRLLETFAQQHREPRILLTSRIVGYTVSPIPGARELLLLAFDPAQIEGFARAWFGKDSTKATQFSVQVRQTPQVSGLARIPLMLSLLCRVYLDGKGDLPKRRVELYERCLWGLLKDWREEKETYRVIEDAEIEALLELLCDVAHALFVEGYEQFSPRLLRTRVLAWLQKAPVGHELRGRDAASVIRELKEAGILITAGAEVDADLLFLHRTFHEYLTAKHLSRMTTPQWLAQVQPHFWFDADWAEVIPLLAGCLDDPQLLLDKIREEPDDAFHEMLLLSGRCLAETLVGATHGLLPEGVVRDLLALLRSAANSDPKRAERVLVQLGQRAVEGLLAALRDPDAGVVRQRAAAALGGIGGARAVEGLLAALHDPEAWVRGQTAEALGKIGGARAVDGLLAALRDPDAGVRKQAASALGEIGDGRAVEGLLAALRDPDAGVRRRAAGALGRIGDARAVEGLLAALRDPDAGVRRRAAAALGEIDDARAVDALLAALRHDPDEFARGRAAGALGRIGDARAVEGLLAALRDPDAGVVRRRAAAALGGIGGARAMDGLLAALRDPDAGVRQQAAEALGEIGEPALDGLLAALRDPDAGVRQRAAWALGGISDGRAVDGLLAALRDPDAEVRRRAAWMLGGTGDARAVEELLAALRDPDAEVRRRAAGALGRIGDARAVDGLLAALRDPDAEVRRRAAGALGATGDGRAVDELLAVLHGPDAGAQMQAAEALAQVSRTTSNGQTVAAVASHLLQSWAEGDQEGEQQDTLYELLHQLAPKLRAISTTDNDWSTWRVRLMPPTLYPLACGLAGCAAWALTAERLFRHILDQLPGFWPAQIILSWLLLNWPGRAGEAETLFPGIVQASPDDAETWNMLGSALSHREQYGAALAAFQRAAQVADSDSARATCLCNGADTYLALAELDQAEAMLAQAGELVADHPYLHLGYAQLHLARGELDRASARCQQATEKSEELADAHFMLGLALLCAGRQDEAIGAYEKGFALATGDMDWTGLADACKALEAQRQVRGNLVGAEGILARLQAQRDAIIARWPQP